MSKLKILKIMKVQEYTIEMEEEPSPMNCVDRILNKC